MKAILVLLAAVIAVASCEQSSEILLKLSPPKEDDSESSNLWQEHSKSSTTTEASLKTTKDSYLPIDDSENQFPMKIKSTTSRTLSKKVGGGSPTKLNPIPESDDEVEHFEESAQSYYGGKGWGGGYGGYGRPQFYPSRPYGGGFGRPYPYRPYGGYGYGR